MIMARRMSLAGDITVLLVQRLWKYMSCAVIERCGSISQISIVRRVGSFCQGCYFPSDRKEFYVLPSWR